MILDKKYETVTAEALKKAYALYSYTMFNDGRINLFGIRNNDMTPGTFNDVLGLHYVKDGEDIILLHTGTVDPGSYYMRHPMHPDGTAVIKYQQAIDAWAPGYHKGYKALVQMKPVWFYRITRDQFFADGGKINVTGKICKNMLIGANMHRAHEKYELDQNTNWSAACQVRNDPNEYNEFIRLTWVNNAKYNYAVFSDNDFIGV